MAPSVLVTGGAGWLGRRLLAALAGEQPEARIRALALDAAQEDALHRLDERVEVRRGDLRNPAAVADLCAGAEGAVLFHCAAVIHPRRTREFTQVNVDGARRLLEAAERAGVRRAVMTSSNSPVGVSRDPGVVFDEASPCRPYLGYGRSKLEMERIAAAVHARGRLETVVVRAPWFYGPGQPERQTRMFSMIRAGRFPIVGGGENRRSMAYVDDLCRGLLLAARVPEAAGQLFWIADARPYTMNEIVETIARLLAQEFALEVSPRRLRLPGIVSDVAELADRALQACGLYSQDLHVLGEMNKTIACCVARAERVLGYQPSVALEEGMRRSIRWCVGRGIGL